MKWIIYWTADMKSSEAMIPAVMNAIFSNCAEKPEKFRTSKRGLNPLQYQCDAKPTELWSHWPVLRGHGLKPRRSPEFFRLLYAIAKNCVHNFEDHNFTWFHIRSLIYDPFHISFHRWFIPHGNIRTHKWPAANVSGFIAWLVRAAYRYREVKGSSPEFFRLLYAIAKNCVHNCEDHSFT